MAPPPPRFQTPSFQIKQPTLTDDGYAGKRKKSCSKLFLIEMGGAVEKLHNLDNTHYHKGEGGFQVCGNLFAYIQISPDPVTHNPEGLVGSVG